MNKLVLFSICIVFLTGSLLAQNNFDIKLYAEQSGKGSILFADNNEYCPVSVQLDFKLENMKVSQANKTFVIPARTKGFQITEISPVDTTKKMRWSYNYFVNYGNVLQEEYDEDFAYTLPFEKGKSVKIDQGYNGKFSHQNEFAIDFGLKTGEAVYAARGGIVVNAVSHNTKNCPNKDCAKFNNYILVYHSDGTFASYDHFKQNGVLVKKGDIIQSNQLIGYSGNTGWSNGPHLHFVVFLQKIETRKTLKTYFSVENGEKSVYLEEGKFYLKNY